MDEKIFGYVRISSKDQNESRQVEAMFAEGVTEERLFIDKESGKDFNRPEYQTLKRMLKISKNSLLLIKSIDRLGRNYREILNEWRELTTEYQTDIRVLDMPLLDTTQYKDLLGTFISDLILQILSFVAEQERENIKVRQAEGIATAKARNVKFGRPPAVPPSNFEEEYRKWKSGKQTAVQTMKNTNTKKSTFYKLVKIYEGN